MLTKITYLWVKKFELGLAQSKILLCSHLEITLLIVKLLLQVELIKTKENLLELIYHQLSRILKIHIFVF